MLVGSFPFATAFETLSLSGAALAGVAKRLTDGEAQGWNTFPGKFLPLVDAIEIDDHWLQLQPDRLIRQYRIKKGRTAADIKFVPAGYGKLVAQSYDIFNCLRDEGKIRAGTRFQQSLPTPFSVVGMYFGTRDIEPVLPIYQHTLLAELEDILSAVPADELSIQWDVAVEVVGAIEGHTPGLSDLFPLSRLAWLVAAVANRVPEPVELGLHFCYGNPGGRHIIEPRNLFNVVSLCNEIVPLLRRELTWLHMPVPISRTDDSYFAPLRDLHLAQATEFYLGLVHLADGTEGARRRIAAAKKFRQAFGIATECGFRYVKEDSVPELLKLHREIGLIE